MSRITKEIARNVAIELTKVKKEQLKKIQLQLKDIVSEIYKQQLPEEVVSLFKKYPKYFQTAISTRINSPGFQWEFFNIIEMPQKTTAFTVNDTQGKKIISLDDTIRSKRKDLEKLVSNIEATLFNLRTYKNVEKEFKEAFILLPEININTALSININDLRIQLK